MVAEVQVEIRQKPDLAPDRAAELLNLLASLTGNINEEILKRDWDYNVVLLRYLDSEEKANRAKIRAETSPEYKAKMEARNTQALATEIIRSLKHYLRIKTEEFQQARFQ